MAEKKAKRPGRIKQMIEVYRTTKVHDRNLPLALLACFLGPIVVAVLLALLLPGSVWFSWILWPVTGILVGILLVMIVLGRRAEKVAYDQIEGRPGAVGAVVQSALRRSWRGSEVPVAINRNQDAVYRVIGRGGVVLISEGSRQRTQRMASDEERKVKRALSGVTVVHLYVGPDGDGIPLAKLSKSLVKLKPALNRNEIAAVFNRLASLQGTPVGIPKGMDPNKVRSQRPR
ncbi:hypothetical protein JOF28_000419 [Leucobacter exalbidus]|uniref:DUF4191 domain-containing protein n=1 Tax=Leucobacter exalbidus TaxID=662960 RepID=A0A940T2L3_9MICO|nr:DUF4191 domain-containing protein [Leucobacter exalbidus]MBP1325187.1 hypothetical protein [Leucobacter exalbidus]